MHAGGNAFGRAILFLSAVALVAVVLVSLSAAGFPLNFSTRTITSTVVRTSYAQPGVDCLLPVPANATTSFVRTSQFSGTMVTYADGSQVFYPETTCPQPVSDKTYNTAWPGVPIKFPTNEYELALAAVTNRTFIADEEGAQYLYSQPDSFGYSSASSLGMANGPDGQGLFLDFYFFLYGNQSQHWCNGSDLRRIVVGGIDVSFYAPFSVRVNGSVVQGSGWLVSDPMFYVMTSADLQNENTCTIT